MIKPPKIVGPDGTTEATTKAAIANPTLLTDACPKCGGQRPKEEIAHKACGNCANLDLLNQELATRAEREKAHAEAQAQGKADLKNLPDLDKTASALYDDERGVVWVGLNLKDPSLDAVGLLLLMDQAKPQALAFFVKWRQAEHKRKSKIVRVVESVGGMMDRLGQAAGKAKSALLKP